MEFGDIFWIPMRYASRHEIGNHWVALLFLNKINNVVYYQTLASGLYKIFPNFGLFADGQCQSCNKFKEYALYQKYKTKPSNFLDVDTVTFLNPTKYNTFLDRETYICTQDVIKDNYFDFSSKVASRKIQMVGKLLEFNQRNSLIATNNSTKLSPVEKTEIFEFYQSSKARVNI